MSNTRDESNAESLTAKTALQTAADTVFIANVDLQITEAIAQGKFVVTATTNQNVNAHTVYQYYAALGYQVWLPDHYSYLRENGGVAGLFGWFWQEYWLQQFPLGHARNPVRISIGWR